MSTYEQLEGIVSAKIGTLKNLLHLIKLEAKLAGLSVFPLILNLFILFIILICLWFSLMLLIGTGLYLLCDHLPLTIVGVIVINVFCFIGLLKYLAFNIRNLSFEKTRAYFSQEAADHDRIQKTSTRSD